MVEEALLSKLLELSAWFAIVSVWVNADATTRCKQSSNLNVFRLHKTYEVFHNDVYTIFMEVAMVAKAEQIQFQALALNHKVVGNIHDTYLCEIGLPSDWTQRGKLRTVELHPIIILWMLVVECFQYLRRIV